MIKRSIFFQLARNREWKKILYGEGKKLRVMREKKKLAKREKEKTKEDKRRLCNQWELKV